MDTEPAASDDVNSLVLLRRMWLSGEGKFKNPLPTVHIPEPLASYYNLNKPCKVTIRGIPSLGGILIKYFQDPENQENDKSNDS